MLFTLTLLVFQIYGQTVICESQKECHELWTVAKNRIAMRATGQKISGKDRVKVSSSSTNRPLSGVTVLALEHAVAVPFATRQLADLGARVIKVERPDGGDFARHYDNAVHGDLSSVFVWVGRGKESITLDLKTPSGREVFDSLMAQADVFIQNLSPGAIERMGYSPDSLREKYPRLIVVSNSGYGSPGPYSGKRAYDALVQCESGIVATTGTLDHMVKPGFSAADIAAGMYMYAGVLMALFQRERTGQGTIVEVTMLDAITDFIANHIYFAQHNGAPAPRVEFGHPSLAPYGAFPTADGERVIIGVQNDREWARLCHSLLNDPSLIGDPRTATNIERNRNREFVEGVVSQASSRLASEPLIKLLDEAGIAVARINSLLQAAEHPQHLARERWIDVDSPSGPVPLLKPVITEPGKEFSSGPIPSLGQHTETILRELGYDSATIDEFEKSGVTRAQ